MASWTASKKHREVPPARNRWPSPGGTSRGRNRTLLSQVTELNPSLPLCGPAAQLISYVRRTQGVMFCMKSRSHHLLAWVLQAWQLRECQLCQLWHRLICLARAAASNSRAWSYLSRGFENAHLSIHIQNHCYRDRNTLVGLAHSTNQYKSCLSCDANIIW